MDNLTHSLVGLALAESGLRRRTALATATLVIGANVPDIDALIYLVGDGKETLVRCKCRAPSFHNISVLHEISRGCMIADMVAIIGSLDIVMGEVDR